MHLGLVRWTAGARCGMLSMYCIPTVSRRLESEAASSGQVEGRVDFYDTAVVVAGVSTLAIISRFEADHL